MKAKVCSKCNIEKPIDEFSKSSAYRDGYRGQCKLCRAQYSISYYKNNKVLIDGRLRGMPRQKLRGITLRRKYRITQDDFDKMLQAQNGVCAICEVPGKTGAYGVLSVDHCHKTKEVRGLLCSSCNSALGALGDDAAGISRVVKYLSREFPFLPSAN